MLAFQRFGFMQLNRFRMFIILITIENPAHFGWRRKKNSIEKIALCQVNGYKSDIQYIVFMLAFQAKLFRILFTFRIYFWNQWNCLYVVLFHFHSQAMNCCKIWFDISVRFKMCTESVFSFSFRQLLISRDVWQIFPLEFMNIWCGQLVFMR